MKNHEENRTLNFLQMVGRPRTAAGPRDPAPAPRGRRAGGLAALLRAGAPRVPSSGAGLWELEPIALPSWSGVSVNLRYTQCRF